MSPYYFLWTGTTNDDADMFRVNGSSDLGHLSYFYVRGGGGVRPEISLSIGEFIVETIVE